ncbi:MAG: hypothetical protein U0521_25885 [Anaerolineae bacterium]
MADVSPIQLPFASHPLLAVGGEIKNTFCLARDHSAWMSAPNGDMEYVESMARFEAARAEMQARSGITPERIACDLHPGYHSTRWAAGYAQKHGVPLVRVQHHHAHIAAVMAEHGRGADEQVIGLALDGTGYGTDGAIWGGEVLVAGYRGFTRAAHLKYTSLPGGDAAIRKPYRLALATCWRRASRGTTTCRPCGHVRRPSAACCAARSSAASTRSQPAAWGGCSTPSPRWSACGRWSITKRRRRLSWKNARRQ